ncbi:MAG: hypothetical protein ABI477_24025 [Chryseolinea sp.]
MKTKSIFFAAILVAGVAVGAIAKEVPSEAGMAVVSVKGSEVIKVIYKGISAGKVRVNVYNAASKVVFSESRNTVEGFILPLNFTGLEAGQYTVEIVDAVGAKSEKIEYQPTVSTTNIHVVKLNQAGKFLLSVAKNTDENISVRIFDEQNNLVHASSKKVAGDFAQLFSFAKFSGAYTVEVSNEQGQTTVVSL